MSDSSNSEGGHADRAATPARQGRYGKPVFWVLVVSTTLAIIALFTAWGFRAPSLQKADAKVTATRAAHAADFSAPEPAPITAPPPAR